MKALTRVGRHTSWLPHGLTSALLRASERWRELTAPYPGVDIADAELPFELRVLRYAGRLGLFWAATGVAGGTVLLSYAERADWALLQTWVWVLHVMLSVASGAAVYLVSRFHRRRFAILTAVLLISWLALVAGPLWEFGWKLPVTVAVPSLLALLSYWKDLDP